jgi:pimeloyl-ACP methyl ester carboxylesterase
MQRWILWVVLCFSWFSFAAAQSFAETAQDFADPDGLFVEIEGATLYYVDRGNPDGNPLVLLHGLGGSTADFYTMMEPLEDAGYRVIAFDRPPFGLADKSPDLDYSLANQAAWTVGLMDYLGIERATLIGHSAGGPLVAKVALDYPERVDRLVLLAGSIDTWQGSGEGNAATNAVGFLIQQTFNPDQESAREQLREYFSQETLLAGQAASRVTPIDFTSERIAYATRWTQIEGWEAGLLAFGRAFIADRTGVTPDMTADITQPTLLIWGREDSQIPLRVGLRLQETIPNNQMVILEEAGHLSWEDAPEAFNAALLQFLQAAASTTSESTVATCERQSFDVRLAETNSETYQIVGDRCLPIEESDTLLVLLTGAGYNRLYWDIPFDGYSFVDLANAQGYATLNLDRIGSGESDLPPAADLSRDVSAYTVSQVLAAIQSEPNPPNRIILVGFSAGSGILLTTAAQYPEHVDGIILTGSLQSIGPAGSNWSGIPYLAKDDPRFAGRDIPDGYVTTPPGARGEWMVLDNTDPEVLGWDEANKDLSSPFELFPTGFFANPTAPPPRYSEQITAPVLLVVGERDVLFCMPPDCTDELAAERSLWPAATSYQTVLVPNTGHQINLHRSAPEAFSEILGWLETQFPLEGEG